MRPGEQESEDRSNGVSNRDIIGLNDTGVTEMGSVTIEASYLVAIVLAGHAARWSWSRLNASGRIGLIVLAVVKLIEWCIVEGLSAPGPAQSSGLVAYCVLSCLATVSAARYVVRPSIASPSDGGR